MQSGFLGLQSVVNNWMNCADETYDFCFNGKHFSVVSNGDGSVFGAGSNNAAKEVIDGSKISLGPMAIPEHLYNLIISVAAEGLQRNMWLGQCIPVLGLVGKLLREKESKIREGMKMMGLIDAAFYLSQFLANGVQTLVTNIFSFAALLYLPQMLVKSDWFLMFLVFWLQLWNVFQLATLFTVMFDSATFGKIGCFGLVYMTAFLLL